MSDDQGRALANNLDIANLLTLPNVGLRSQPQLNDSNSLRILGDDPSFTDDDVYYRFAHNNRRLVVSSDTVGDYTLAFTENGKLLENYADRRTPNAKVPEGRISHDATLQGTNGELGVTTPFTQDEKLKLAGVATGAQLNVQANWTEPRVGNDAYILNKPELATVATLSLIHI